MKPIRAFLAAAALVAFFGLPSAQAESFSPAVTEALKGLSSEEFAAREKALQQLQLALGQQIKSLIATDDPEMQTRLVALMEFNDGLSRWAIDTLKLPEEARKAQLSWAKQEKNVLILAKAYSNTPAKRLEAVKELSEDDSDFATSLLGRLLDDEDRAVYVAAMEAVWERKPTDAIVNSLWNRAVEAPLAVYGGVRPAPGAPIVFRGRNLGVSYSIINRSVQDSGIAAEVLLNLKPPQLAGKLKGIFEKAVEQLNGDANGGRAWAYMASNEAMKNAYRLAELYKNKELVGPMMQLVNAKVISRSNGQVGADKYFWSNRTTPLATLLIITEQNPDDFKMKRRAQTGNMWTSPTEAEENAAIEKLQLWWKKNAEKYGEKADLTAATRPAGEEENAAKEVPAPAAPAIPGQLRMDRIEIRINGEAQAKPK